MEVASGNRGVPLFENCLISLLPNKHSVEPNLDEVVDEITAISKHVWLPWLDPTCTARIESLLAFLDCVQRAASVEEINPLFKTSFMMRVKAASSFFVWRHLLPIEGSSEPTKLYVGETAILMLAAGVNQLLDTDSVDETHPQPASLEDMWRFAYLVEGEKQAQVLVLHRRAAEKIRVLQEAEARIHEGAGGGAIVPVDVEVTDALAEITSACAATVPQALEPPVKKSRKRKKGAKSAQREDPFAWLTEE